VDDAGTSAGSHWQQNILGLHGTSFTTSSDVIFDVLEVHEDIKYDEPSTREINMLNHPQQTGNQILPIPTSYCIENIYLI
jgi:hypothetical protein